MFLNVRQVFADPQKDLCVDCEFDFSSVEFYGGYPLKKPVKVCGKVFDRAGIVTLLLKCRVEYHAPCDKCSKEVAKVYEITIERILANEIFDEDNDEIILLENYTLNLQELCFSEVVLRLPTRHLCNKNCKGLCPVCGKDLNLDSCDCNKKQTDPRLESLRSLLD